MPNFKTSAHTSSGYPNFKIMRLSKTDQQAIIDSVKLYDKNAKIFLYGSRVNPNLLGGDIDLLIVSHSIEFSQKIEILVKIKEKIGEQKIDLKVVASFDDTDPFLQSIKKDLLEL